MAVIGAILSWLLVGLIALTFVVIGPSPGKAATHPDFTPNQVEAIQKLIRDYVRDNPGIILDAWGGPHSLDSCTPELS